MKKYSEILHQIQTYLDSQYVDQYTDILKKLITSKNLKSFESAFKNFEEFINESNVLNSDSTLEGFLRKIRISLYDVDFKL